MGGGDSDDKAYNTPILASLMIQDTLTRRLSSSGQSKTRSQILPNSVLKILLKPQRLPVIIFRHDTISSMRIVTN